MQHKVTTKLFNGTYQYKVVLVCAGASLFRCKNIDTIIVKLSLTDISRNMPARRSNKIGTAAELAYALQLADTIKRMGDQVDLRVESPWISIYTNNKAAIDSIIALGEDKIKYISSPPDGSTLAPGTILMSKRDYDYRVTMGKSMSEHSAFVGWAEANTGKVLLTRSCKRDLLNDSSWGGSHFYITGDNVLLMAKMHLGSAISKIERITKK